MLSLKFNSVYINDFDAVVGKNEKEGYLNKVKNVIKDYYNGEKSFELSQVKMQRDVIYNILDKNKLINEDIDLIIGGDLSNQISSTSYAVNSFNISYLGIYSACSSFIEGLIIASNLISSDCANKIINVTGSHNLVAERQFRFPVEYGAIKNVNSTFTATGAVACLLTKKKGLIKINDATIGTPIDYEINDPNMIGAIMAPACAETIINHLNNFNRKISYYDLVLTGDLGNVGLNILKDYLKEEFSIESNNIIDAGSNVYKNIKDVNDGASGPAALPLYLFYNIFEKNKYKKILVVGTGSLHSRTLVNQKIGIPAIAHAISIEVIK